jgi:hypothetical protein
VQLMPLQYLNIGFLEIETACQHLRDFSVALHFAGLIQEFYDTAILAVLDGVFGLCDKVRVEFSAHGERA